MKLDIECEISWMENFRGASSLTPKQFDAVLLEQRELLAANRKAIEPAGEDPAGALLVVLEGGASPCYDCGALCEDGSPATCPICVTVDRAKLPAMAWGVLR